MTISEAELTPSAGSPKKRNPFLRWLGLIFEKVGQASIIFTVIMVLLLAALYPAIVRVIPAGAAGVIYKPLSGGTQIDRIYGEGVHVKYPWDILYVYNVRIQTILHEITVTTNRGLPITLRLAIRFHPEPDMVGQLHQRVGPNYAETIIVYQIESVLRKRLGLEDPEDIYTNREGILTSILEAAAEEVGQRFVRITDVIIREIVLPNDIVAAIEEKLVHQQKNEAYVFRLELQRQEAERLRIEALGIRDYQASVNETLNDRLLYWRGIQATVELASSQNAKVVVVGAGESGLPLILGPDTLNTSNSQPDPVAPPTDTAVALPTVAEQVMRPIPQEVDPNRKTLLPFSSPVGWGTPPSNLEGVEVEAQPTSPDTPTDTFSPIAGVAPGPFAAQPGGSSRYKLPADPVFAPHSPSQQPIQGQLLPSEQHTPRASVGNRGLTAAEFLQAPLDVLP